jgi:rare lipoprotein A
MRTMTVKTPALRVVLAFAGLLGLLAPASALAATGGATATAEAPTHAATPPAATPPATTSPSTPTTATPIVSTATPEPVLVTSTGPVTLQAHAVALLGHVLSFSGSVPQRDVHKLIAIERYETASATWVQVSSAHVSRHGAFTAHWRANMPGRITVRAVVVNSATANSSSVQLDSSAPAQLTVYRPAISTYFGPGFYGQQTACGQTLTPLLVGVANRTLPCGTLIEVSYAGRRLIVPVIDRGPYANGAEWDLTQGAAMALGIEETVNIGTLIAGSTPNTPTLGLPPGAEATAATGGAIAG